MATWIFYFFNLALLLLTSCSTEPDPIRFGEDICAHCKMTIIEPNYGGELVTKKGRIYKFDAIECMIDFEGEHDRQYKHRLAIPFDHPKHLHAVDSLHFVISKKYKSPMGANLAAFLNIPGKTINGKKIDSWQALKKYLHNQ